MSMIAYHVRVLDRYGNPLSAGVELHTRQGMITDAAPTNASGIVRIELDDELEVTLALVMPHSGHWVTHEAGAARQRTVRCEVHEPVERPPWWQAIMGKRTNEPQAGEGIRIGLIDFGFRPDGRLAHVRAVDDNLPAIPSHGERVARFLTERPNDGVWGGVAPGAEVRLAAVDSRGTATTRRVAEAIEALTEVEDPPHLINMSLGFFREDLEAQLFSGHEDLQMAVEACREAGCLPIAAVGNNPDRQTAIPAALDGVIGVSSFGLVDAVPRGSWAGVMEHAARSENLTGVLTTGEHVYQSVLSSLGDVDVYGPGIGVRLKQEDGVIYDYIGTSYAAPLVTGILAIKLSSDKGYLEKRGTNRTRHAEAVLNEMRIRVQQTTADLARGIPRL